MIIRGAGDNTARREPGLRKVDGFDVSGGLMRYVRGGCALDSIDSAELTSAVQV